MRKTILALAVFVGATLLLTATGVLAASPAPTTLYPTLQEPMPIPTITPTVTITHPVAAMIAAFFGLDYTQVQALHDQGIGYGNMTTALFVAQASGLPFEEIMAMRGEEEGGGWGYIIKELGLGLSRRDTNLGAIMSGRVVTETEPVTGTVQGKPGRGPKETPPGWEHGRGHGRGHNH